MPTFGSLFAGIGGMDLGLERAGWECRWQVEINPYRRSVLERHWPKVRRYNDVREVGADLEPVTLLAGGFPCKGVSPGGLKQGLAHPESGLWSEFARIIGVVRPRLVLVENSSDLPRRGLVRVLGDLAELGFDAEWSVVSACAMGAPHARRRLFLVAYRQGSHGPDQSACLPSFRQAWPESRGDGGVEGRRPGWLPEPAVDRVAHGIPRGVVSHPLEALGSAVVPVVAEGIGRWLRTVA